jgi:hypothetical protein
MEPEVLDAYRAMGKDVIGVRSFSTLVPEVFDFGEMHLQQLHDFFSARRELARTPLDLESLPAAKAALNETAATLRTQGENVIIARIAKIENCLKEQSHSYADLNSLFGGQV